MSTYTFSVVIPTYNRANLIGRAIRSVLSQTYSNFEIIIVDDGSTDNTEEVIQNFGDARIKYVLHDINRGLNNSRNTGIKNSTGEYVAFLDSDDEWLPKKLEKQLEAFSKGDREVGACYTWLNSIDEDTKKELIVSPLFEGYIFEDLLYSQFANPSSMVVRRSCFDVVGIFDTDESFRACEDWDLWLRLSREYKFAVVPEVLTIWWNHSCEGRLTNNAAVMFQGFSILRNKHPEMKNLPNTLRKVGSASLKMKGYYLFERGRRYSLQASRISHEEGIKLGKIYLHMAVLANPLKLEYLVNYIAAYLLNGNYPLYSQVEDRVRKSIRKILGKFKKRKSSLRVLADSKAL
jgi:glycosyltransferase involved in cell wall biosynthesis